MSKSTIWIIIVGIIVFAIFYISGFVFSAPAIVIEGDSGVNVENSLEEEGIKKIVSSEKNKEELLTELPTEFLPDLVPLPAQDVDIINEGGIIKLVFSTAYYNKGTAPLELIADPETAGVEEDIERDVFQRITKGNGDEDLKLVGNFLWHQEHLHYHFDDFIDYELEAVDVGASKEDSSDIFSSKVKATFCIRDVSIVHLDLEHRDEEARYLICGKERQGVSVGWADTYFYSYADQNIDITGFPSGVYKLAFNVNPERKFDELNYENNRASVMLDIDMGNLSVRIIEEEPENYPNMEHIHIEQDFN